MILYRNEILLSFDLKKYKYKMDLLNFNFKRKKFNLTAQLLKRCQIYLIDIVYINIIFYN